MTDTFLKCRRCSDVRHRDEFRLSDRYGKPVCPHCHRIEVTLHAHKNKKPHKK
jgi:Zn finger protein HypA/HybF involved in hydrogenase expression